VVKQAKYQRHQDFVASNQLPDPTIGDIGPGAHAWGFGGNRPQPRQVPLAYRLRDLPYQCFSSAGNPH
jgi:hypothetical protein